MIEQERNIEELYKELQERHCKLKTEYQENTIIQSMNDMKTKYEELKKNTIPKYKYEDLMTKNNKMEKVLKGTDIILQHIQKTLDNIENVNMLDRKTLTYKIQIEIAIIQEIINDM
jgi:hypothetical protein